MGSVAKLISQNIFWRGLYYLSNFILTITIAQHFQAASSGDLFYITNNCAFVILLLSLSFEAAIVFFGSNNSIEQRKLFWVAILMVSLASFLLLFFYVASTLFTLDADNSSAFSNIFLYVTGNLIANFMAGFYFADKRFLVPNLVSVIVNGLLIFLLINASKESWLSNSKFIGYYFSSFFVQGIILALILLFSKKEFLRISFFSKKEISKVYQYLSLVFLSNILTFFCYRVDYWFVSYYCSSIELGNYIQVSKLVQLFFVIPGMLAAVLFPLASGGEQNKIRDVIPFLTRFVFFTYALACLGLSIIGYWLFPFVFGESFSLMYNCFLFYIPGVLGFSALYTFTAFYSGRNKVIINLKGCAIGLVVAIIGDIIFVPRFGINGAAGVSSFAYLFYFGFVLRVFTKEFGLSMKDFFLIRKRDWIQFVNTIKQLR
jgi:O-antigen/teichoic acid export membrane protein